MKLYDFADLIDRPLTITRYSNCQRFTVQFDDCEIKEDVILTYSYGNGATLSDAVNDYCKQLSGKTIVFNAMNSKDRQTYRVPVLTED